MQKIVVATDGSEPAGRAIDLAAELSKATGAELCIITIGEGLSQPDLAALAKAEGDVGAAIDASANSLLMNATQRARAAGASAIQSEGGWGDPAEELIAAARRHGAELIVLGRRGRGRLAGLLLGSVSQKVVSLAPCAVVVVP